MIRVRRDLSKLSSPNLLFTAGSTRTDYLVRFEYLQGWRLTTPLGSLLQAWIILAVKKKTKQVFRYLNGISCVSVCAHCFMSFHWRAVRRVWFYFLYTHHIIIHNDIHIITKNSHWSFSSRRWTAPDLSLSYCVRCSNAFVTSMALHWTGFAMFVSLLY